MADLTVTTTDSEGTHVVELTFGSPVPQDTPAAVVTALTSSGQLVNGLVVNLNSDVEHVAPTPAPEPVPASEPQATDTTVSGE